MAQNNIKVTFNSLYSVKDYKTHVLTPVEGKVYFLAGENYSEHGIIKKDGINYSGIVGISDNNRTILKHTDEPLKLKMGNYELVLKIGEDGILHINSTGDLANSWLEPLKDYTINILDYFSNNSDYEINFKSTYGTPNIRYENTNDLIESDSWSSFGDTGVQYKILRDSNLNNCKLSLRLPENLQGQNKAIEIYPYVDKTNDNGIEYGNLPAQLVTINIKLQTPVVTASFDKQKVSLGDTVTYILDLSKTKVISQFGLALPNNTWEFSCSSAGEIDFSKSDGKFEQGSSLNNFIIKSLNEDRTVRVPIKLIKDNELLSVQQSTTVLQNNQNYNWSAINVGQVTLQPTEIIGYYSFNVTSLDLDGLNLKESDFTEITETTSEPNCGKTCYPIVLTTGKTPPTMTLWSVGGNGYGLPNMMVSATDYFGTTIRINDIEYNMWCLVNPTLATDTTKVKIEIK